MQLHGIRGLYAFPGWVVEHINLDLLVGMVRLRRDKRCSLGQCSCGGRFSESRRRWQTARDLPLGPVLLVEIHYEVIQGRCGRCRGYATFCPPGIDLQPKATRRLMQFVSDLCRYMPLEQVANVLGLSAKTAMRWDRQVLHDSLPEPDLDNLQILLVDEKKLGRGPFATFVMNGVTGELLYMEQGSKGEALEHFIDQLSHEQQQRIVAAAIDRDGSYREVLNRRLPQVDIVYDKFHLIKNYNDVIDEVRRTEWRKAKAEDKQVIKGQRYNLFRRPENRSDEDIIALSEVVQLNENLNITDILKDDLRQVWAYRYRAYAERWLEDWVNWALSTTIEPLKRFARGLWRDKEEVLNFCKHQITNARMEAFNNIVARILHRACGMRDMDYLFLKLRQESLP